MPERPILDHRKIARLRAALGMSLADASAAARFASRSQWYDIESGAKFNVTLDVLARIAKALKCKPRDLLK